MADLFQKVLTPGGVTLGALGLTACSADPDFAAANPVSVIGGKGDAPLQQHQRQQLPTNVATYDPFVAAPPLADIDPTQPIIIQAAPIQQGAGSGLNLPPSPDQLTTNAVHPVSISVDQPRLLTPHRPQNYHAVPQAPVLRGKTAIAPPNVPAAIRLAIAAGNRMQNKPYRLGGGHSNLDYDDAYDCSGTVSYVLRHAGLLQGVTNSTGFMKYGESGKGRFITIWAKPGHVFLDICGLRLDTGGSLARTGPRWKPSPRSMRGFVPRHPRGF